MNFTPHGHQFNVLASYVSPYSGRLMGVLTTYATKAEAIQEAERLHGETGRYYRVEQWGESGKRTEKIVATFGREA